jgi:hypothetical protein
VLETVEEDASADQWSLESKLPGFNGCFLQLRVSAGRQNQPSAPVAIRLGGMQGRAGLVSRSRPEDQAAAPCHILSEDCGFESPMR